MAGGHQLLLVEDNVDIREGLAEVLESSGYVVTQAATAEEGLKRLGAQAFALVVSDFMLPFETGAWMLSEAARQRRLEPAVAFIITAHPRVEAPDGVRVFQKPVDLPSFLAELTASLEPRPERRAAPAPARRSEESVRL